MRRYGIAVVAVVAALLTVLMGGPASAATAVLTYGSQGGSAVAVGDVLSASGTLILRSSPGGTIVIKCPVGISPTVTTNPPAPATATATLTSATVTNSGCTVNMPGVSGIRSITFDHLPYNISFNSSGTVTIGGGTSGPFQLTFVLSTALGPVTCAYQPSAGALTGTLSNTDNTIRIVDAPMTKNAGPSICPTTLYLTLTLGPVTGLGGTVYLN